MSAISPLPEIVSGLYGIAIDGGSPAAMGSPAGSISAYYLTQTDPAGGASITLQSVWTDTTLIGWYLFIVGEIAPGDAAAFVRAARASLPLPDSSVSPNPRGLVWLQSPNPATWVNYLPLYQLGSRPGLRTVVMQQDAYAFDWAPLALTFASGVAIRFDPDSLVLTLKTDAGSTGNIQLLSPSGGATWYSWYTDDQNTWSMTLPLTGASPGGFQTRLGLDFGVMLADFGCGPRYFRQDQGAVSQFAYPFHPPQAIGSPKLGFALALHPLSPTDADHTLLALDCAPASPANPFQLRSAALRAPYFRTTTGGAITLAPVPGEASGEPGFAFCLAPDPAASPGATQFYLAPVGTYRIAEIDVASGSPAQGAARWMCGLSGLEYLEVAPDDLLALRGSMPALVHADATAGPALDAAYTTSWLQYPLAGATRYFGQPSASVYFGTVAIGDFAHPVEALLAPLDAPALFPLVPYGGIVAGAGQASASAFTTLESQALAGERHAQLTAHSPGPTFLRSTLLHAFSDAAMPSAETKQGFVVGLNADGSWNRVTLAKSPEVTASPVTAGQFLTIGTGSPAIVPKAIATPLLRDDLFLVISDATALGAFANEISVEGFTFRLDVGQGSPVDQDSTILIFKYNSTTTLRALAGNPSLWAATADFVRDLDGTRQQIAIALAAADAPGTTGEDPFANFRAIADDPAWTGLIALNCAIDGNGMPADLQMLLGGINGQLRAHHFGVQSNKLSVENGAATIEESSLFGLISYPSSIQPAPSPDTVDDFAYELELLTVLFANSKIQDFKVRVGLTINRLFGREVMLVAGPASTTPASPHNTLEINGRYQLQDDIATVTFSSSTPFYYEFPVPEGSARVLRQIAFDRASLVPISSDPASPGGTRVKARFNLAGAVWFNPAPFAQAPGFDLFSFGTEPLDEMDRGLALDGVAVNIAFTLDPAGGIEGHRTVTGDLSGITLAGSRKATRTGSLLGSMPLQLAKFLSSDQGFTASSLGASPVHVLQLEPAAISASPTASPSLTPVGAPPNVTVAPQFGLEFDMPLGSLGLLSSATVGLMAKLIIGWGPSRLVPDTDAAAVLVQLPQVFAGYGGFQLQGILKTVFGDANLLMVELDDGSTVYAVLFNNVQLSILGKTFPSGLVVDFLIFAGSNPANPARNDNNLAWFLGATGASSSPSGAA
jgi:hypothetical protein